jgi:hypothetical protein
MISFSGVDCRQYGHFAPEGGSVRIAGNTDISAQQVYRQTVSSPQTPDILLGKFGLA